LRVNGAKKLIYTLLKLYLKSLETLKIVT
jgi:hypothetical protein